MPSDHGHAHGHRSGHSHGGHGHSHGQALSPAPPDLDLESTTLATQSLLLLSGSLASLHNPSAPASSKPHSSLSHGHIHRQHRSGRGDAGDSDEDDDDVSVEGRGDDHSCINEDVMGPDAACVKKWRRKGKKSARELEREREDDVSRRKLLWATGLCFAFFLVELFAGIWA
ncbi:hypothetical protein HK101_000852, partial [Irineochytrium annulatum]